MEKVKIRASQVGSLMTPPRGKKIEDDPELSNTATDYLDEVAIQIHYNRKRPVVTDELRKGVECEEKAITLLQQHEQHSFLYKNETELEDEWTTGTPDVLTKEAVYDTKAPFNIWSFHKADPPVLTSGKKTDYYWQLQAYMALTDRHQSYLAYCLVNTPERFIEDMKFRAQFKFDKGEDDPEYKEYVDQLEWAHTFDDLPLEKRVKIYSVERSEADIKLMRDRVELANEYLKDWEL